MSSDDRIVIIFGWLEERRKKSFLERFKEGFWSVGNDIVLHLGERYIDMFSL